MFWFSAALATGFSTPPRIAWVDAECNALDDRALPADETLRLVWSQTSSSSPPGGPVHRWTTTLDPADIRLRQQDCGVEAERFELRSQTCGDVPVLQWTGRLQPGATYAVERFGNPVAHMRVAGSNTTTCLVPPLDFSTEERTVGPLELDIALPAHLFDVADGRTWIELSTQRALAGTAPYNQPTTSTPIVSRLGEASVAHGSIAATWTVTRRVHASTLPDPHGDAMCSVEVHTEARLAIPGLDGPFVQIGPTRTDGIPGPCEPGVADDLASEDAVRSDLDARIAGLSHPEPVVAEPDSVLEPQRRELAITKKSAEYRDDPVQALEDLVRRSGWREPEASVLLARHLMDAGRYLEAGHWGNEALRDMPQEPSRPRAPVLLLVAEAAAAGIQACEGQRCFDLARVGGAAVREYRTLHPEDPRSDAIEAALRAGVRR